MDAWIEEHSEELLRARDKDAAFTQILAAARDLGSTIARMACDGRCPLRKPKFLLINNYPGGVVRTVRSRRAI